MQLLNIVFHLLVRQAEGRLAYVLLRLLSVFFSFLTIVWSKEISVYTRPIFTKFSGLVDMWLQCVGFAIGQGTLPSQPILGDKSAEIGETPFFLGLAFHNGWSMEKRMDALTPLIPSLPCVTRNGPPSLK